MTSTRSIRLRRFLRNSRGSVLLEFSLVLALLLILIFGIIDFGRALYTVNAMSLAAREGARYAAVSMDPSPTIVTQIQDATIAHMNPFAGAALQRSQITVTPTYDASGHIQSTAVKVVYPFKLLTPIGSLLGLPSNLSLHTQAEYRWEMASS